MVPSLTPKGYWLRLVIGQITLASQHGQVFICSAEAIQIITPMWKCDLEQGCKPKN